ncbi:MAG: DciA family protein [Planctomycetota bacterium]
MGRKRPPPPPPEPPREPRGADPEEDPTRHLDRQRRNKQFKPRNLNAMAGVLKDVLKDLHLVSKLRQRRLHKAWANALQETPGELSRTRIVRLARGHLTVEVDSPSRMQEYARYLKAGLIERLNAELQLKPPIIDIHFVLGTFDPPDTPEPTQRVDAP